MADKLFSDYVCITYWNLKQTILFDFKIVQSEYVLITTERGLISARGGELDLENHTLQKYNFIACYW